MDMIATIGITATSPNRVIAIGKTNRIWFVSVIANARSADSMTSILNISLAVRKPAAYMISSVARYPPSKTKLNTSSGALIKS